MSEEGKEAEGGKSTGESKQVKVVEDDATKEFNFKRDMGIIKKLVGAGDEMFINAKFPPASESFMEASDVIRKCTPTNPNGIRWKKAMQSEIKRRIDMVLLLLPKEKKKSAMDAIMERRAKEAENNNSNEDPAVFLQKKRQALREDCGRIRRRQVLVLEQRRAAEEEAKAKKDAPPPVADEAAPSALEDEPRQITVDSPNMKLERMSLDLKSVMTYRRNQKPKLPVFKYDGISGIRVEGYGELDASPGFKAPASPASPQMVKSIPERLEPPKASAAERLEDLVGPEFVPTALSVGGTSVDAKVLDSLEQEIIRELELNRKAKARVSVSGTYASSALSALVSEPKVESNRLPYAMVSRPAVGRSLRLSLGLRPAATFSSVGDQARVRKATPAKEGDASEQLLSEPRNDPGPGRTMHQIRAARTQAVVREFKALRRVQGMSALEPEAAHLVEVERAKLGLAGPASKSAMIHIALIDDLMKTAMEDDDDYSVASPPPPQPTPPEQLPARPSHAQPPSERPERTLAIIPTGSRKFENRPRNAPSLVGSGVGMDRAPRPSGVSPTIPSASLAHLSLSVDSLSVTT